MFGPILGGVEHERALSNLNATVVQARAAAQEHFKIAISSGINAAETIDSIVGDMRNTGWNSNDGNLDLFVVHFGSILASAMLQVPGVQPVFRSITEANHCSVWHPKSRTEYFPFHKILKCLTESEGESASQMVRDLIRSEADTEPSTEPP